MSNSVSRDRDAWIGAASRQDPRASLVHLLRSLTVDLDMLAAEFADASGLHPTDLRALIHLLDSARDGITATPSWLGAQMGMHSAAVTALLDRLERHGHIQRIRDDADRRRVRLVVDDRAVDLAWSFFGPLISRMLTAMAAFDEDELGIVRRFLTGIRAVVVDQRHSGPPAGSVA